MKNDQAPCCLAASLTGPLNLLEKKLLDHCKIIEEWFENQWRKTPAPLYGSVDLRNSGFKITPVDMNLFPAGFNNLNPTSFELSIKAAKISISQTTPHVKNILLIPENHSRNPFYWENVAVIINILTAAEFKVRIGSLSTERVQSHQITLMNGEKLLLEPIYRENNFIKLNGFSPDVIILNNDLSDGIPDLLKNIKTPILPPSELGWSLRSKSNHFQHYQDIVNEFSQLVQIDPWFISSYFRRCDEIDFIERKGEEILFANAEALFSAIQKKYKEYKIDAKPFLVMKADKGTYGMAVMTVRNPDELLSLNRKQRTKMSVTKGGQPVSRVILQEGVYTFETWGSDNAVAEPVVYLWGSQVVGGFYRVHKERGVDENLNSPGMHFESLPFVKTYDAYGVISRLSMLAAAREMFATVFQYL